MTVTDGKQDPLALSFEGQCLAIVEAEKHASHPETALIVEAMKMAAIASISEIDSMNTWAAMFRSAVTHRIHPLIEAFPRAERSVSVLDHPQWEKIFDEDDVNLAMMIVERKTLPGSLHRFARLAARYPKWRPVFEEAMLNSSFLLQFLLIKEDDIRMPAAEWIGPLLHRGVQELAPDRGEMALESTLVNAVPEEVFMLLCANVAISNMAIERAPTPLKRRISGLRSNHGRLSMHHASSRLSEILSRPITPQSEDFWRKA